MDKHAYEASVMNHIQKRAGYKADIAGALLNSYITNPTATFATTGVPEELVAMNADDGASNWLPGVGLHNLSRRVIDTNKAYGEKSPRKRELKD